MTRERGSGGPLSYLVIFLTKAFYRVERMPGCNVSKRLEKI